MRRGATPARRAAGALALRGRANRPRSRRAGYSELVKGITWSVSTSLPPVYDHVP